MSIKKESGKFYLDEKCYVNMVTTFDASSTHTHDFLELVYIFKGKSMQYIDDNEYPVAEGDMLFINLGSNHRFETADKLVYADIIVKPEFICDDLKGTENAFDLLGLESFKDFNKTVNRDNRLMHFNTSERRIIETLINLIRTEQESSKLGGELILLSSFNTLLTLAFRKMALPMKSEEGIGPELLKYIKANCSEHMSLEKFAEERHYNPAYFSRLFKQRTGYKFTEFLNLCRLELACKLLCDTDLSVEDVMIESGFSDRTKFYNKFYDYAGTTPLKYRKSKK